MSTDKKLPTLPQETTEQLVALRGTSPEEFYALVKSLRAEGWPLRAISEPFDMSKTTASNWESKYPPEQALPEVPKKPIAPSKIKPPSKRVYLTEEQSEGLRSLAEEASQVRRNTYDGAPERIAAKQLEERLIDYVNMGVSKAELARICGVSDSSIKQRLRKYT